MLNYNIFYHDMPKLMTHQESKTRGESPDWVFNSSQFNCRLRLLIHESQYMNTCICIISLLFIKRIKGPWATSLTWETSSNKKNIWSNLWLNYMVDDERQKPIISFLTIKDVLHPTYVTMLCKRWTSMISAYYFRDACVKNKNKYNFFTFWN